MTVADEDHFDVDFDGFGFERAPAEGIKHFERLNLQPVVIQRALQRAPHPSFRERLHRIHDQEAAIRAEQRTATEVHKIAAPAAARVVGPLNRPKKIRIGRRGLENNRGSFLVIVSKNDIDTVNAEGIAFRTALSLGRTIGRLFVLLRFSLALLEGVQIIQQMVPHLFEVLRDAGAGIFFLELFDDPIHKHGSGFLFEVAQFACQFPRERERLAVDHREFLPELLVLSFNFFRNGPFELSFVHHLRYVLDRNHLAFEHREDFRQRHRPDLHVAQRKLITRDAPREIVHQFFFADSKALDDSSLLPLEWFALKHLRNSPPQEIDSRLHVFLEGIGLPARKRQQPWPVWEFEIVDVAAVQGFLGRRMEFFDHAGNRSAAAGAGQSANEYVVAGGGELHAHFQSAQSAFLPDKSFARIGLCRCFERDPRKLTPPAQLCRDKLRRLWRRPRGHEILSSALL